jgi:hypothetical protein
MAAGRRLSASEHEPGVAGGQIFYQTIKFLRNAETQ